MAWIYHIAIQLAVASFFIFVLHTAISVLIGVLPSKVVNGYFDYDGGKQFYISNFHKKMMIYWRNGLWYLLGIERPHIPFVPRMLVIFSGIGVISGIFGLVFGGLLHFELIDIQQWDKVIDDSGIR